VEEKKQLEVEQKPKEQPVLKNQSTLTSKSSLLFIDIKRDDVTYTV